MKIHLQEISIREIAKNYKNKEEEGVTGYSGLLNIRPKYQREFVYKDSQRNAVIETVRKNFPLNVMYWVKNSDGTFEVLDGQQRTISICEYIDGKYSLDYQYFHNLTDTEQEQILNYKLMIYICEGNDKEKLDWFKTINIAGEKLTDQELRNAIYTGTWLTDAKKYFSKTSCPAYNIASDYLNGSPIRQDYLETTLERISAGNIEEYMAKHQHDENANELWQYFQNVINWIQVTFPNYRKEMKGVQFGPLYNQFKNTFFDASKLESEITKLMQDEDVTKKSGIYEYVLTRNEKYLSIRAFSDTQKRQVYESQKGVCPLCIKKGKSEQESYFEISQMEADHITPWSQGGKTDIANCQMLCRECNRRKSDR